MTLEEIKAKRNTLAEMWGNFYYDLLCSNVPHRSESGKTFIDSAPTIIDDLIAQVERANEVAAFYTGNFSQSQEELMAVKENLRSTEAAFDAREKSHRAEVDELDLIKRTAKEMQSLIAESDKLAGLPEKDITFYLCILVQLITEGWTADAPDNGFVSSFVFPEIGAIEIEIHRVDGVPASQLIREMTAEIEKLRAAFDASRKSAGDNELLLVGEIEKLRAENLQFRNADLQMRAAINHAKYVLPEQSRKDTARLDWLEQHSFISPIRTTLSKVPVADGESLRQAWTRYGREEYATLRDAIDAQEKPEVAK